ncbi:MAG TPA: alpha/beta hydrolase [Chryseolinea sp.]|nr:alpha/beta hydrolase [Chryseolinea sp.]
MLKARVNDYQLNYVESGNGDFLVFVHGSASDYRTWEIQMEEFGKYYHTISYSRRFHFPNEQISDTDDYSMMQHVDDLETLLKFLSNKPVHLVGHSYGAFICLLLAIKNPRLVRTLVLAEPPVITLYVSNTPKPLELIKLLFSKPKIALAIIEFGIKGIEPAKAAFEQNNVKKALDIFGKATLGVDTYLNLSSARHQQAFDNLIKAELLGTGFPTLDKEKIQNINLPILLISAQNSRRLFHYLMDELQYLLPHAERIIIPDASHIMHEDNATNYNSAVLSFLKQNGG